VFDKTQYNTKAPRYECILIFGGNIPIGERYAQVKTIAYLIADYEWDRNTFEDFKNRLLRRIFECMKEEVAGD
jgi:hypothetical protein